MNANCSQRERESHGNESQLKPTLISRLLLKQLLTKIVPRVQEFKDSHGAVVDKTTTASSFKEPSLDD